tara:strand:+ start:1302 stop:1757 length:456 start_codon:yes stop_codon:yes gene_type:complete
MAREIKITDIAGLMAREIQQTVEIAADELIKEVKEQTPVFKKYTQDEIDSMPEFYRVPGQAKAIPLKESAANHVGSRLRNAWQMNVGRFRATVTNNMEYAEPVLYGNNLPPSWRGQYRTRQNTVPGFPDLIVKKIATQRVPKIVEAFRRRN